MYSNPFTVKLPLLKVGHPSQTQIDQDLQSLKAQLDEERARSEKYFLRQRELEEQQENLSQNIQKNLNNQQPVGHDSYTPNLFQFEHVYDRELTPRKGWQARLAHLDSLLEQERQLGVDKEARFKENKAEMEKEIERLRGKLESAEQMNESLRRELKKLEEESSKVEHSYNELQQDYYKSQKSEMANMKGSLSEMRALLKEQMQRSDALQKELGEVKEENYRLKKTVVNKENEVKVLEQVGAREKERREAEVGEFRKLFYSEQDRATTAIREAEGVHAKIEMYKEQAEKAERTVQIKDKKLEELNAELQSLRKEQIDSERLFQRRLGEERRKWEEGQDCKVKSAEIKVNRKDMELEQMEKIIIELRKKLLCFQ